MTSSARDALSRLMAARGSDGMLLVPKPEKATTDRVTIPPGSMALPPCRCPQCRVKPIHEPTLSAITNASQRRQGAPHV
ncbi:hypothetical protein [Streptomyces sp. NPDC002855]|uniref:hypothetical protein n=1 Tax=Streptomyces sp. NPDC002855 TaxID=3154437 RepID=UPI00332F1E28